MVSFKNNSMNKILILGASGLLGTALVNFFVEKNYMTGALSRSKIMNNRQNLDTYTVDVLNYDLLDAVISKYDVIINCIGQITNPICNCMTLNTVGMNNIVKSVKKHNKYLVHISTVAVYGSSKYVNEESDVNPETPYGTIKYFAEYIIKSTLEKYTILRVTNLYGRNQNKGVIAYLLRSFYAQEKQLYFDNNGDLKRYYLQIDDLSNILNAIILKQAYGIYNIRGNQFITIKELVSLFSKLMNYDFNVEYTNGLPIENIEEIDIKKLEKNIEFNYKHTLQSYLNGIKLEKF